MEQRHTYRLQNAGFASSTLAGCIEVLVVVVVVSSAYK